MLPHVYLPVTSLICDDEYAHFSLQSPDRTYARNIRHQRRPRRSSVSVKKASLSN